MIYFVSAYERRGEKGTVTGPLLGQAVVLGELLSADHIYSLLEQELGIDRTDVFYKLEAIHNSSTSRVLLSRFEPVDDNESLSDLFA